MLRKMWVKYSFERGTYAEGKKKYLREKVFWSRTSERSSITDYSDMILVLTSDFILNSPSLAKIQLNNA